MKMDASNRPVEGETPLSGIQINVRNMEQQEQSGGLKGPLEARGITRFRHKTASNNQVCS